MKITMLAISVALLHVLPAAAQTLTPEPFTDRIVGMELEHPLLDGGDLDLLSFAGFLYARLPLGEARFLAELPFARWSETGSSAEGIGNVMLGLEGSAAGASLYGTLRLPTASNNASVGVPSILTNFYRLEAWAPDAMVLSVGAIWRDTARVNGGFDFQLGSAFVKVDDADLDVILDYGVQYVQRARAFGITGGLQGRGFATGTGNFADRTLHELRLRADYTGASVRPELGVRFPLDEDIRESIRAVIQLGVQFAI
jgi:hypothetical protein